MLDSQILDLDESNIGTGLEFDNFTDEAITEFDQENSEGGHISIQLLAETEDERTNIEILEHSIYNKDVLYKLCLACCLSDSSHQLGLKIAFILKDYDQSLHIMVSLIYLRLNYQQFKKHS